MNPGVIRTRKEVRDTFGFNDEGVDHFFEMLSSMESAYFKIDVIEGETLLIFEKGYWDKFLVFMKNMGYEPLETD